MERKKEEYFIPEICMGFTGMLIRDDTHSSETMAESCGCLQKSRAARKECKAEGDLKGA